MQRAAGNASGVGSFEQLPCGLRASSQVLAQERQRLLQPPQSFFGVQVRLWQERLPMLSPGFTSAWESPGENADIQRAPLHEVIDAQATTRHDQLEPALGIGEDGKVVQGITFDDEQIGRGTRSHRAHLSLHPQ